MLEGLTFVLILVILLDIVIGRKALTGMPLKIEVSLSSSKTSEAIENELDLEPIQQDVLDYINMESDEWARGARKSMARRYYSQSKDWNKVLNQLKMEDRIDNI